MPDNINWTNVWQSVTDFWLPTFGWVIGIAAIILIVFVIKKKMKK